MTATSSNDLPIVLVPGLLCTARLYAEQIPALWRFGPVTVADHTRDDSMAAIARRILAAAPPRFALAGLSLGGYIALEIMRQAPERVAKLAILDSRVGAELPAQTASRLPLIELAKTGRFAEIPDRLFPVFVHRDRLGDAALKSIVRTMAEETGPDAFLRETQAIMTRADARPVLATISCPTLVVVGDNDALTPPKLAEEIAAGIRGARLVVIADCGHLSTLERPDAVNQALAEWMES
ncbi:MAG TPA: alpha/beta fold hydrolase [Xanthobacteraceae bacterium]|nr:alpha/beta fold hydrolase [Xanthobacteraceae bacterium]